MACEQRSTPKRSLGGRILAMVKRIVQSRGEQRKERHLVLNLDNCSHNTVVVTQNNATDKAHVESVADNADDGNGQGIVAQ